MKRVQTALGDFSKVKPFVTLDDLRKEFPVLQDVPDSLLKISSGDLFEVLLIQRKCPLCTGYLNCWRDGDGKGEIRGIKSVTPHGIEFEEYTCQPARDHFARIAHAKMLEQAGMTKAERRFSFNTFPPEQKERHIKMVEHAERFANEFTPDKQEPGIYLFGSSGIGKTHLLLAVCNQLIDRGVPAVFTTAEKLMDRLRDAIREGEGELTRLKRWYSTVPMLAIDEFAQETVSDWTLGKMFEILDDRWQSGLSTWFASNTEPPFVYDHYHPDDPRIAKVVKALRSRVFELALAGRMTGRDHRLKNLANAFEPEY
ncbi:ATP-binding protein [Tumebacillus sp. ITR2]|uniref:ATP-binding protein n=1 Tax=Tumebacillus amylolyticus TaxID=2801339 RepID=A0ABS1JC76_9BACL|nr:ATP-binding protein [Tumebacillus amylolyticus]MBL0387879.1 ATP-binding protein [Tumebacillus amylolyticus]